MSTPEFNDVNERIMKAAREHPMQLIYTDETGRSAHGNTVDGFMYTDAEGRLISSDEAEPFHLFSSDIVIRNGMFDVEASEE